MADAGSSRRCHRCHGRDHRRRHQAGDDIRATRDGGDASRRQRRRLPRDIADDRPGTGVSAPIAAEVAAGDSVTPMSRRVTQDQINAYADASGDHNPIHLDPDFARSVGLPGTIAHGLLEMGILADALASWAGGNANLLSLSCRFSKPLLPGDTIICTGTVVGVDDSGVATLEVGATSDRGDRVLTNGRATVRLSR